VAMRAKGPEWVHVRRSVQQASRHGDEGTVVGMAATGADGPEQTDLRMGVQQTGRDGGEGTAVGIATTGAEWASRMMIEKVFSKLGDLVGRVALAV